MDSADEVPLSGRAARAQATRAQFWSQFCDLDVNELYRESELMELDTEAHWRRSTNPDMRFIQALKDELQHTNVPVDRDRKGVQLAEIMSRTDSPAIFEHAGRLLLSSSFVWPGRIHPDLLGSVALRPQHDLPMTMQLASCRVFGHCESHSLNMGHLCSIVGCESAMDIDAYLREFHSPAMVRDANLLVELLLRWRRDGPSWAE